MKTGYDQFFKNARQAADKNAGPRVRSTRLNVDMVSEVAEEELRRRLNMRSPKKKKKSVSIPWKLVGFSFMGLLLAIWGFAHYEEVENFVKRIEVQIGGQAYAQAEKPAQRAPSAVKEERPVPAPAVSAAVDLDHLQKLNERKKELDAREEELNRMESELQLQKESLEKRFADLEQMRAKISGILEDRVKSDEQKIETLVQVYSNMKAPQAAKVFETMDEDLAVDILGRMKKKNAADIMNLLKAEKAQSITEKFAGYKRQ